MNGTWPPIHSVLWEMSRVVRVRWVRASVAGGRLLLPVRNCHSTSAFELSLFIATCFCEEVTTHQVCFTRPIDVCCFCSVAKCVWLFVTPQTATRQASLSLTISRSLPKFVSIESVMPSSHLILCCPLLFLPSVFPSIRVFSNELAPPIRWDGKLQDQSFFSFRISPSKEYSGLISLGLTGLISSMSKGL